MKPETDDLRITNTKELVSPDQCIAEVPVTDRAALTVETARQSIQKILHGIDDRVVVVVGPCSIHDSDAAMEYAGRLAEIKQQHKDDLLIVMRVYFEKPRTTIGWKGLINDPHLDNSFHINEGLRVARKLLADINETGLPAGTEFLDLISPQYIADLVGWAAIGARTTESQGHRELASGLSCPVGFKNGTAGSIQIAVDAIGAARHSHHFLSVTKAGRSAIFQTSGNQYCHLILRGGKSHTNHSAASVDDASALLRDSGLTETLMIDCSHANSRKQHARQAYVCRDICNQISAGDKRISGVMIESNLVEGNQKLEPGVALTRGQSITDACVSLDDTLPLLDELAAAVRKRRQFGQAG